MTKEEILNVISDIMINNGPDGHCDGANIITDFVVSLLEGENEQWTKEYFSKFETHFHKQK